MNKPPYKRIVFILILLTYIIHDTITLKSAIYARGVVTDIHSKSIKVERKVADRNGGFRGTGTFDTHYTKTYTIQHQLQNGKRITATIKDSEKNNSGYAYHRGDTIPIFYAKATPHKVKVGSKKGVSQGRRLFHGLLYIVMAIVIISVLKAFISNKEEETWDAITEGMKSK